MSFPWREIACVAGGGAIGSLARYGVGVWLGQQHQTFPWATLLVNLVGCYLIGVAGGLPSAIPEWLRLLIVTGFLGGLTTFSAFGYETLREVEAQRMLMAHANVAANLLLGLCAVWLGLATGRALVQ